MAEYSKHLKAAIELAQALPDDHGQHRVCALVVDKRGKVLSVGYNSYTKTSPYQKRLAEKVGKPDKIFLHAEIEALWKARNMAKVDKLVVARVGKKGLPLPSKPCSICQEALREFGLDKVECV